MKFLIYGPVHVRFKGFWVLFFIDIQNLIERSVGKQWMPNQTLRYTMFNLGLHYCLCSVLVINALKHLSEKRNLIG